MTPAAAPPTLDAFVAKAQAVVRARIISISPPHRQGMGMPPIVARDAVATISRTLKGDLTAGTQLRVLQFGGTIEVDGKLWETMPMPPVLQAGDDLILMLQRTAEDGVFSVIGGSSGALKVNLGDQSIALPSGWRRMDEFVSKATWRAQEIEAAITQKVQRIK
jgi:hypothetical protein